MISFPLLLLVLTALLSRADCSLTGTSLQKRGGGFKKLSAFPACAVTCYQKAQTQSQCDSSSPNCICQSTSFNDGFSNCLAISCSAADQATALSAASKHCNTAGVAVSLTMQPNSLSACGTTGKCKSASGSCVDVMSDVNNCGAIGHSCSKPSGAVAVSCSQGVCGFSCKSGLVQSCTGCITDSPYLSDPNNCGSAGNVCPSDTNADATCLKGNCQLTCKSGFGWTASDSCVPTSYLTDIKNCGSAGNECSSVTNGQASCNQGVCAATCSFGFSMSGSGRCISKAYLSDIKNCGAASNACSNANGTPSCTNGICSLVCNSGYLPDPITGVCVKQSNPNACATVASCSPDDNQNASCDNNVCNYACVSGYGFNYLRNCIRAMYLADISNCGQRNYACPTSTFGTSVCITGQCQVMICEEGRVVVDGQCVLPPSQAVVNSKRKLAEARKRAEQALELCPRGETACPISKIGAQNFAPTATSGGYECVNVRESVESCGGCSSLSPDFDCTQIKGALGVGCDNGSCKVLSCKDGYKYDGKQCIENKPKHKRNWKARQHQMRNQRSFMHNMHHHTH